MSSSIKLLSTEDDVMTFTKVAYRQVVERRTKQKAALLKHHLEASRDGVLERAKKPRQETFKRLPNNQEVHEVAQYLLCHPCNTVGSPSSSLFMSTTTTLTNDSTTAVTKTDSTTTTAIDEDGDVKMVDATNETAEIVAAAAAAPPPRDATSTTSSLKTTRRAAAAAAAEKLDRHVAIEEAIRSTTSTSSTTHPELPSVFQVKMRVGTKNKAEVVTLPGGPIFLEGTHQPLPSSSATIILKTNYATDDEQTLKYVPYFGDDDKEDVVSDLYNLEDREKLMEFGPEHQERDTNDVIDETLLLIQQRLLEAGIINEATASDTSKDYSNTTRSVLQTRINEALASTMDEDVDRIHQRYTKVCVQKLQENQDEEEEEEEPPMRWPKVIHNYLDAVDSYRRLLCRRCFSYDCNIHGNLDKPNVDLQGELAVRKQLDGQWKTEEVVGGASDTTAAAVPVKRPSPDDDGVEASADSNDGVDGTLSRPPLKKQKLNNGKALAKATMNPTDRAMCERLFLMYHGDLQQIAQILGVRQSTVEIFVQEKGLEVKDLEHVKSDSVSTSRKKGNKKASSMKNYNPAWLKRVEDAEIHPMFIPCDHDGVCSEETCSCIQNRFFCTKHCVWGLKSRNLFRGCSCSGKCTTKSCSCFAAKRECDPDFCTTCGACTDPPNKPAQTQRCRNDNIGMRRHCHLLLARSQIEDAGWGIYTKYPLRKGDFVHEYTGEVISQEEAERRGRIYDKVNRSYLFNLTSDYVVDASRKGNKTRFANHSSKPNCYTKMVTVNGNARIGLFAKEDIEAQSELFFDYRYDVSLDNELIVKPGMEVEWQKNPKMANKISVKYSSDEESS